MTEIPSMPHLLGNPFAAVDVETTGRIGGFHEIIQIAIVPLTLDLEIAEGIKPFYHMIKPNYPERAEKGAQGVHGLDLDELLANAPTQDRVLDYLLEWFSALPIAYRRRLTPLAHNWGFERSFLVPWMGPDLMNNIFTPHPRDTMLFALTLNDRASLMGAQPPFNRVNLTYMCKQFGIELTQAHDALADTIATAKLYAAMLRAVVK